jgi:mono/diheme cytochrome c family protein
MKKSGFSISLTLLSFILVLGTVSLLISCISPFRWGSSYSYGSNGERIYFTAESSSGEPITYSGSIRMMHSITCANCHGPEGKGGRVNMMMSYFDSPNITWHVLTQEEGHNEEPGKGEHEEHPPYTEVTLKRAITGGVDPAGERLDDEMPRWRMSEKDLNDLVEFIKTLE